MYEPEVNDYVQWTRVGSGTSRVGIFQGRTNSTQKRMGHTPEVYHNRNGSEGETRL